MTTVVDMGLIEVNSRKLKEAFPVYLYFTMAHPSRINVLEYHGRGSGGYVLSLRDLVCYLLADARGNTCPHFSFHSTVSRADYPISSTLLWKMAPAKLTCRLRVKKVHHSDDDSGQPQETAILPLRDCPDIGAEIRTRWAK